MAPQDASPLPTPTSAPDEAAPPPERARCEPVPTPIWMKRAAAIVLVTWTVGALCGEVLSQVANGMAIVLSLASWRARPPLPKSLRRVVVLALFLAAWQALSPLVAWLCGIHPELPPMRRYGQFFDTLALAALVCVVQLGVPWRALLGVSAVGWLSHSAAAFLQHQSMWPGWLSEWTSFKANPQRLMENFAAPGEPEQRAGLGLYYHRLKLAHHAVAFLGLALALAKSAATRLRGTGIAFALLLVGCIWATYARASLGAAILISGAWLLLTFGRRAIAPLIALCLLTGALVAFSPSWQQRFEKLSGSWIGFDRRFSWSAAATLAREHPMTGVGFGNHQQAVLLRIERPAAGEPPSPRFDRYLSSLARYLDTRLITLDAHNILLTVFAETGLVGLVLFALLHLSLFTALFRRHREGHLAATAALLAFVGFHCLGVVHYLPFHTGVFLAFTLIWSLGLSPHSPARASSPTPAP